MIYESTEYIKPSQALGKLQLEVNNQWNFKARGVCFRETSSGHCISYNLRECYEVVSDTHTRWKDAEITDEIRKELTAMGYECKEGLV